VEVDNLTLFAMRAEAGSDGGTVDRSEPKNLFVERDRPIEIRNLESNPTEMCRFRKSIPTRPDPVLGLHEC
jgi:hypothetical protein